MGDTPWMAVRNTLLLQLLPTSYSLGQSRSNRKVSHNFKPWGSNARRSTFHGVGIFRFTRKHTFPDTKQQWYVDDGSTVGKFADIRAQFKRLQQLGPNNGYFPESLKRILNHVEQAKVEFTRTILATSLVKPRQETAGFRTKKITRWTSLKACRYITCLLHIPALSTTRMARTSFSPHFLETTAVTG